MILGLGVPELLLILVVVLLIFGPKNLPKIGKSVGKTVKNIREGMEESEAPAPGASPAKDAEVLEPSAVEDAPKEADQFCNSCGAKNPAGAGFCSSCGARLGESE